MLSYVSLIIQTCQIMPNATCLCLELCYVILFMRKLNYKKKEQMDYGQIVLNCISNTLKTTQAILAWFKCTDIYGPFC